MEEGVLSEEGRTSKKSDRAHESRVECIKCYKMSVRMQPRESARETRAIIQLHAEQTAERHQATT